jgi:hypothetical protein
VDLVDFIQPVASREWSADGRITAWGLEVGRRCAVVRDLPGLAGQVSGQPDRCGGSCLPANRLHSHHPARAVLVALRWQRPVPRLERRRR